MLRSFKLPSLGRVLAGARETLQRFPLPLAAAALWTLIGVFGQHGLGWWSGYAEESRYRSLCFLAFFLLLGIKLAAESQGWGRARHLGLAAAAFALLALHFLTSGGGPSLFAMGPLTFLAPALILFVTIAPFAGRPSDSAAFWHFNRASWLSAAFGLLVALVFAGGLTAAFAMIDALFEVNVHSRVFSDTWTIGFGLIWPWQALSGVPRTFGTPQPGYCPKWVTYLASYFLVPLVLVYLAILYVYMVKVIVDWQLPQGQVGYLVAGYATFGMVTFLLAYPLRDSGNRLTRLFHRHFHHALFAPVALLAIAIWLRIDSYGMTEARYLVALFGLWLALNALYFTLTKTRTLLVAPASLAALLLLASIGPWGAVTLSTRSQLAELAALLDRNGLLAEGRIVPAAGTIDWEDEKRISSITAYFVQKGKIKELEPWFAATDLDFDKRPNTGEILAAINLEFANQHAARRTFNYAFMPSEAFDVAGYDVMTRQHLWHSRAAAAESPRGPYQISLDKEAGRIVISDQAYRRVALDVGVLATALRSRPKSQTSREQMVIEERGESLRARFYLEGLSGEWHGSTPHVTTVSGYLLIGEDDRS